MKPVWTACVLIFLCLYEIDKFQLTASEVKTLDLPAGVKGNIMCGDNSVIRIDNVTVHAYESYCATNMSNACILADDDFNSIKTLCNDNIACTIDFPKNTSCLKQDRYFNLSYSCLVPTNLLCNFEFSFCGWKNIQNDNLQWKRYSASTSNNTISNIPEKDHTTNSRNGTYIYLKKHTTQTGLNATLTIGTISANKPKCLILWYKLDDQSSLKITGGVGRFSVISEIDVQPESNWRAVFMSIPEGKSFEMVIDGRLGKGDNAYIALDDIDIQDWHCQGYRRGCNFDYNWCGFDRHPTHTANLQWERSRGISDAFGRPSVDHTNGHGSYIYTESIHHPTSPRRIIFITFDELEVRCLSLWYYRYGYTPGHLNIYTVVKEREEFLQSMVNTRKQLWSQFQANVYNATQIILEFNFTENNRGGIALDDIFISPTMCADEVQFVNECFEENAELQIQCPVSDVRNLVMAFDPNITTSCQTSSDQVENKLEEIFKKCENASMCVFTPAELLDSECYSISKRLQLMFSCTAETSTLITTPIHDSAETSTVISTQIHNSASNPMYTIIIVSVLVIVLAAFGVITVVCYRRKTAKLPQHIGNRQDETANDMTDSTDYTARNYNEMKDIDISKINENKNGKMTTHRDLQIHKASVEKEENNCNKYESLATIRNSEEHVYESGCAQDNQYQSLTNQRKLDEHPYESTEHASAQYQSLTNRSEADNHAYASTSLHTDVLQNNQ